MNNLYFLFIFGFLLIGSGFAISDAYGAGYIKFDGVDGESTDRDHKDWIILLSFSQETWMPEDSATTRDQYEVSDIIVVKELDKSSPKLAESIAKGKVFPKVEIHLDSGNETYYAYELTNVMITSYSISGTGNDVPIEEFSLNYEEIAFTESSPEPPKAEIEKELVSESVKETMDDEMIKTDETKVPGWVQTTAQFWIDENVSDREFTDALGFLVKEKIIEVQVEPALIDTDETTTDEPEVPDWIATTTEWWINGQVPEDQFLEGIKWMIQNRIIIGV
ncbi:MAG: type VI secretion system tube protein Hcp [Nitrosopumilus sp.]|nr:type VI secretion system tube protein Hcp [Nitrosopumilus sp.]